MSAWHRNLRELYAALSTATAERHLRSGWVDGDLEWVHHERSVMHDKTNAILARAGMPPASEEQIRSAESRAMGHVDYVQKFAMGCTDIIQNAVAEPEKETS